VPAELAPAVFLPEPYRSGYWRAGAQAQGAGACRTAAITAGLTAARSLTVTQRTDERSNTLTHDTTSKKFERPADPALYNAAIDAGLAYREAEDRRERELDR
jgi:hypothetical protein